MDRSDDALLAAVSQRLQTLVPERPPLPTRELALMLADGRRPPRPAAARLRALSTRIAGLGLFAKVTLAAGVAVAGVGGAATAVELSHSSPDHGRDLPAHTDHGQIAPTPATSPAPRPAADDHGLRNGGQGADDPAEHRSNGTGDDGAGADRHGGSGSGATSGHDGSGSGSSGSDDGSSSSGHDGSGGTTSGSDGSGSSSGSGGDSGSGSGDSGSGSGSSGSGSSDSGSTDSGSSGSGVSGSGGSGSGSSGSGGSTSGSSSSGSSDSGGGSTSD